MNANIILDGFSAIINQLIATAVAEAVKPLNERITVLEGGEWIGMGKAVFQMADIDFNEAVRNVLDGYNFISRNDVVDMVDKVVENAIEAYDFNDIIDWDNKIEEGISNYDFGDMMRENLSDIVDEERVQELINESINEAFDNLVITRN